MQNDNELVIDTSNKTMYTKTIEEMRYINSYGYSVKCKIRTMRRKNYSTLSLYPVNGCTRVSEWGFADDANLAFYDVENSFTTLTLY